MSGGFHVREVAPCDFGVWIDPTLSRKLERPHTAAEALATIPGAVAVLDGPMFRNADPDHPDYARYRVGKLDYHVLNRALGLEDDAGTATDGRGVTLSVLGNAAFWAPGDLVVEGADCAVQLYPALVVNGVVVASPGVNRDEVWRAGVGMRATGELLFAVGRGSMHWFAQEIRNAGATEAGYTDGGGSARLQTLDGFFGSTENRRVLSWLYARK